MKKTTFGTALWVAGLLASCSPTPKGDSSITTLKQGNHELTLCDFDKVTDTLTIPLSEWVEDLQIVRFENTDTALFKFWWPAITDQYIGIRQHRGPFKLFDHQGKFLCDVGSIGQGPGEYASLYSEIIDEKNRCIYLAPFFGSSRILKYDINGTFMTDFELGEKLNKPKISLAPDGSLSVFHLCFQDMTEMLFAHIAADGTITKYRPTEGQIINPKNSEGKFVGFVHEIWSYGNTEEFMLKPTWQDTLFAVCPKDGNLQSRFALQHAPVGENVFLIYNALPGKYVATVWGKGTIVADLKKQQSYYVNLINDFVGHLPAPMSFSNGWFFAMYEPMTLMERIETRLAEDDCTDKDREVLNRLLESLDEDDNNVMFIGKLKK